MAVFLLQSKRANSLPVRPFGLALALLVLGFGRLGENERRAPIFIAANVPMQWSREWYPEMFAHVSFLHRSIRCPLVRQHLH